MKKRTVVIIGSSGLVGGLCLREALESRHFSCVKALVRKRLDINHAKLTQVITDFSQSSTYLNQLHADCMICCLGTTIRKAGSKEAFYEIDYSLVHELATQARRNGIRHLLLVSATGANSSSTFFYNQVKGQIEDALIGMNFPGLSIFRPSLLLGQRKSERRFVEDLAQKCSFLLTPLCLGPWRKYQPVKADILATAIIRRAEQNHKKIDIIEGRRILSLATLGS